VENSSTGTIPQSSAGDLHPAFNNPVTRPANPPPEGAGSAIDRTRPQSQERSRGYQPQGSDWREKLTGAGDQQPGALGEQQHDGQQQPLAPSHVEIDGVQWSHDAVRKAIAHQVEADAARSALPQSADDYRLDLPADFQAPAGAPNFEFDKNDPLLARARELAHARGVSQQTFSDMLGVFAASKIQEQQQLAVARSSELGRLGSAAPQRIDAISRWLQANAGADAAIMVRQIQQFPVSSIVTMFEKIIHNASSQGGTHPNFEGGRSQPDNTGKIEGYEKMTYAQRRAAQDSMNARRGGR
jgi:hypothetical protein